MRTSLKIAAATLGACAVSVSAFARDYDMSNLPYSDAPSDRPTAIAISTLTSAGVLQGDPSGTIRPNAELNRAEFMKIVMSLGDTSDLVSYNTSCFPDVPAGTWYAPFVCKAKSQGVVTGHAIEGIAADKWRFKPNDPVQYEEAVKVLAKRYALTIDKNMDTWYGPYLRAAESSDLAISGLRPGDRIKRGEMARLVTGFLAFNEDELDDLRNAEAGRMSSSSSSSSSSVSSGTGSSTSSSSAASIYYYSSSSANSSMSSRSSASSMSSWANGMDPNSDTSIRSQVLTLGSNTAILGAVNLYSNNEPLNVDRLRITLVDSTSTLDSLQVYDENKRYLGRATLDTTIAGEKTYTLRMPVGTLTLPRRDNMTVYVRAAVKSYEQGGQSNQNIRVASFGIEGTGEWSSDAYSQTYSDTFPTFLTARARISKIENAGEATASFVAGTNQRVAAFRFTGEGDSTGLSNLRVNTLTFQVDAPSGVSLSNVYIKRQDGDEQLSCGVSGNTVTCSGIPTSIGSVKTPVVIYVYADVALTSGTTSPNLRLSINNPGTSTSAGSVTWTDGTATFSWLPFDAPIARGTSWQ